MKRLAAMHDWPLLNVRDLTAVATACARSADGMTMKGSLPPSSSTVFFSARPARLATSRPARSLPVSVTAATRSSSRIAGTCSTSISSAWNTPSGNPALAEQALDGQRALRHVRRVLQQHDVAGHQRRRGEPEHLPERKIPGHDREHGAHRLVANVAPAGFRGDFLVCEESLPRARA